MREIDIKFNVPPYVDKAADYIQECVKNQKICGDGEYTKKCNAWIEERTGAGKCLLTTSCTHATELAALLCNIHLSSVPSISKKMILIFPIKFSCIMNVILLLYHYNVIRP